MKILTLILALGAIISISSCSGVEGCKDPRAENFDPEADQNCCCEYFQMQLNVEHLVDSNTLELFTAYADANNDSFELKAAALLLSNVQLVDSLGQTFEVSDSLLFPIFGGNATWLIDDFASIRPTTFIVDLGSFIQLGEYKEVHFTVGLKGLDNDVNGVQLDDDSHPLDDEHPAGHFSTTALNYAFSKWEIILPASSDTSLYEINDPVDIQLKYDLEVVDGADAVLPISIDYRAFFDGVSFVNDSSNVIIQKIKNNTSNAFSIQ